MTTTNSIVCAYCGATHPDRPVPPKEDDAAWAAMAKEHGPEGCLWISTCAFQRVVPGTVKVITLRENTPARVEYISTNPDGFSIGYRAIQNIVNGVFQALNLGNGLTLWINDNGRINGMEPNFEIGWAGRWKGEVICGPALITDSNSEGDTTGLDDADLLVLQSNVATWKRFTPAERKAMGPLPTHMTVTVLPDLDLDGDEP